VSSFTFSAAVLNKSFTEFNSLKPDT